MVILNAKHLSCITLVLVFKLLKQSCVYRKSLIFPCHVLKTVVEVWQMLLAILWWTECAMTGYFSLSSHVLSQSGFD